LGGMSSGREICQWDDAIEIKEFERAGLFY